MCGSLLASGRENHQGANGPPGANGQPKMWAPILSPGLGPILDLGPKFGPKFWAPRWAHAWAPSGPHAWVKWAPCLGPVLGPQADPMLGPSGPHAWAKRTPRTRDQLFWLRNHFFSGFIPYTFIMPGAISRMREAQNAGSPHPSLCNSLPN